MLRKSEIVLDVQFGVQLQELGMLSMQKKCQVKK